MKKFLAVFFLSFVGVFVIADVFARAQGESRPWKGDGGAVIQPSQAGSGGGGTPVPTPTPTFLTETYTWTNADIVTACPATLDCLIPLINFPAKTKVHHAHLFLTGSAAGPTTLTGSVGRVAAAYIDLLTAGNMKAAANTLYGDASAEVGSQMLANGYLTSWTATSQMNFRLLATGANIDTVTGFSGYIVIEYSVFP